MIIPTSTMMEYFLDQKHGEFKNFQKNISICTENQEEKIFLITDRPAYYTGDTLWFKACVLLAVTMQKEPVEKILYLELRGRDNRRIKRTYKINDGIVRGVFYLPDTLSSGIYKITAYTNWMLNKYGGRHFEKDIYIYNDHYDEQPVISDNLFLRHIYFL